MSRIIFTILLFLFCLQSLEAKIARLRLTWRQNPAKTMVIAWDQLSGENPEVIYSMINLGKDYQKFPFSAPANHSIYAKGMSNNFAELKDLIPNTVYYFVIKDSEGFSRSYSFKTMSSQNIPLSILAGGDSRNHREVRQYSNTVVSKLRADFVLFSGDMTNSDSAEEWKNWFDDWQLTISKDGRITPILVARGNHENSNKTLYDLFYLTGENNVYGLSFGKNLLRVMSLNSLIAPGGHQKQWITKDLEQHQNFQWRIAQYHFPMRPHNSRKPENNEQADLWCPLFERYKLQLAIESDAHLAKITYPIVREKQSSAHEGFKRDDINGTTYIGEGGWGAPLRSNNDEKVWTKKSGSFNQIKWLIINNNEIKIRTIIMEDYSSINELNDANRLSSPSGLRYWIIDGLEEYIIQNKNIKDDDKGSSEVIAQEPTINETNENDTLELHQGFELLSFDQRINSDNKVIVEWITQFENPIEDFILERSIKDGPFERLKKFKAKARSTNNNYSYIDNDEFHGKVAYRLKKVNLAKRTQKIIGAINFAHKRPPIKVTREKVVLNSLGSIAKISYSLPFTGNVVVLLVNTQFIVLDKAIKERETKGEHHVNFNMKDHPKGSYNVLIKLDGEILKKINLVKTN